MGDAKSKIAQALMKDPEWEYGSILPIAARGPREGESYGAISLAIPDIIRDPLQSWVKIRDSGFADYNTSDVLNVAGMASPMGLLRGGTAKAAASSASEISAEAANAMRFMKELKAAEKIGAPLPDQASAAMQRARDQGFDTSTMYYRGTTSDRHGNDLRLSEKRGAVYASPDPGVANEYGGAPALAGGEFVTENGRVMPLLVRTQAVFDPQSPDDVAKLAKQLRMSPEQLAVTMHNQGYWSFLEQVQPQLKAAGFRGYKTSENAGADLNSIAMFDPADFRSPWAQFAPENAGKNGLLLEGSSPIAAIAAALQEDRR